VLEDVCDNLFNPDPYYQQGGDMVRVGGLEYTCTPSEKAGARISAMRLNGKPIEAAKTYKVAGWAAGRRRREGGADLGRRRDVPARSQGGCAAPAQSADLGRRRWQRGAGRADVNVARSSRAGRGTDRQSRCDGRASACASLPG
jgi:sulfur-oxidizing protein SoxB